VLITVHAAGVNFPDGLMVRGEYQMKPPRPFTPGNEVAGVVTALGAGVTSLNIGQRVVSLCGLGGFAEQVVAAADRALPIPDGMDFNTAGGLMLVYGTSLHALQNKAKLKAGETLLVLGAAGGVGWPRWNWAAPWARASLQLPPAPKNWTWPRRTAPKSASITPPPICAPS
jgi:NADPH2:quinone reductase